MIQTIKNNIALAATAALLTFVASMIFTSGIHAATPATPATPSVNQTNNIRCGSNIDLSATPPPTGTPGAAGNCADVDKGGSGVEILITNIINAASIIVGAICVIMIIVGGFRYVTSAGESNSVSGAKNTILYAIVGLIIVAFAQVIVQFVLQKTTS